MADHRDTLWEQSFEVYYDAYFEEILSQMLVHRWSIVDVVVKILVMLTASGCAVAGWALWHEAEFRTIWAILSGSAAVLAIVHAALSVPNLLKEHVRSNKEFFLLRNELEIFRNGLNLNPDFDLESATNELVALKRKYGDSVAAILEHRDKCEQELAALRFHDERLADLQEQQEKILTECLAQAKKLSGKRKRTARELAAKVKKEIDALGMQNGKFEVRLSRRSDEELVSTGLDDVEFMFSANPGEPAKPLKEVASGGEISRVMLALKTVLADADDIPTLVFDEIDAGVGGAMARTVGAKLSEVARSHQVICITHLPHSRQCRPPYQSHQTSGSRTNGHPGRLAWQGGTGQGDRHVARRQKTERDKPSARPGTARAMIMRNTGGCSRTGRTFAHVARRPDSVPILRWMSWHRRSISL